MKVLITGGTGLLGSALIRKVPKDIELSATYFKNKTKVRSENVTFYHLDVADAKNVRGVLLSANPDVIIHAAAKSSPDYCETNQEDAWKTNVEGTRNILKYRDKKTKVFFMSSNQVFSGKNPPYKEGSKKDPVNLYGRSKVTSEDDIKKSKNGYIIRLMTMYGWPNPKGTKNTAVWVIDMLKKNESIKVVDDVFNNFLYVDRAARYIWKIVKLEETPKLIQLAGKDVASRFEFSKEVAHVFNLDKSLIFPVKKSFFKDEAPRPLNTIYRTDLMEKMNLKPLGLRLGLSDMYNNQSIIKWDIIK